MFTKITLYLLGQFSIFYYLCLGVVFIVVFEIYLKRQKYHGVTSKVPTAYGWPIIGIAYQFIPVKKFLYVLEDYFKQFKSKTFCAWMGTDPFIITKDPEVIKQVLSSEEFLDKSRLFYAPIDNALHNGIITSPAPKWKHNRKLINSSFTHTILTSFIPTFHKSTEKLISKLDTLVGTEEQHILEILKHNILKTAIETTMGIAIEEGFEMEENLIRGFHYIQEKVAEDSLLSMLHLGFLAHTSKYYKTIKFLRNYVENLIKLKFSMNEISQNNDKATPSDAIKKSSEIFINQALGFLKRGLFTTHDAISETHTMVVGSFDTVSTTIFSVLVMIAMHPDVQEKLYEEVLILCPGKDIHVDYEQLQQLPYMDMIIDETLRLMPSIPVIGRQLSKDTHLQVDGIPLPKNMQIVIPIFIIHRCKDLWGPNANAFNPDNFLPENVSKRNPYAFIAFSKGARNCIGMRYAHITLRILLLGLVRNYRFSTSFKYDELVFVDSVSLHYDVEPKLKLEKRSQIIVSLEV